MADPETDAPSVDLQTLIQQGVAAELARQKAVADAPPPPPTPHAQFTSYVESAVKAIHNEKTHPGDYGITLMYVLNALHVLGASVFKDGE